MFLVPELIISSAIFLCKLPSFTEHKNKITYEQ